MDGEAFLMGIKADELGQVCSNWIIRLHYMDFIRINLQLLSMRQETQKLKACNGQGVE